MVEIIRSLFILVVISGSIGGISYYFSPTLEMFTKVFLGAFCLQVIFFLIYNNILRFITRIKLEQEMLRYAQLSEKNTILIECEGCKKVNTVPIDLSTENKFNCTKCDAENKIQVEFKTILPTNIIYDK